jgi:hypothetical protein
VSSQTPQTENGASAVEQEQFCSNCGKPVHRGAHFCGFCGHGIPSLESQTEEAAAANQARSVADALPGAVGEETAGAEASRERLPPVWKGRVVRWVPTRVAAVVAAVAALVAVIGAVLVVLKPLDNSDDTARADLRRAAAQTLQVSRAAQNARTLDDLVDVGRQAQRAVVQLESSVGEVTAIDDPALRGPTAAVLSAQRDLLGAYAQLGGMRPERLSVWQSIAGDATEARLALAGGTRAVERLGLGAAVLPGAPALERGQRALDGTVAGMQRRLAAWRQRYRHAKHRRTVRLRRLARYGREMRAQLAAYSALRADLANWLDRFGPQDVPFGRAEDFLSGALSQRQAVLTAIAAMSLPAAGVAASHRALQDLVGQSVRAMDNAIDGARECTQDPFCLGDDFRHHTDWEEFMATSREIDTRLGPLTTSWAGALDRATERATRRTLPRAPTV